MSLPYPGWNVVFGATPTAAFWSELGANDDALAAGTGFNTGAIGGASLNFAATGANSIWWQELARVTLASGGSSMDTGVFTARKYLRIIYTGLCSSSLTEILQFNGDTGNNYAWDKSSNWAALAGNTSTSGIQGGASLSQRYYLFDIQNIATQEKNIQFFWTYDVGAGAATQNAIEIGTAKWANTSAQINRIAYTASVGAWTAGSELIILGHD